jgi:hypothetical protein
VGSKEQRDEKMTEINEMNAYRYGDNFAIVRSADNSFAGCEHNQQEADAIAKYLTGYTGSFYSVVRNSKDDIRKAKAIRRDVVRVQNREMILEQMGVGR